MEIARGRTLRDYEDRAEFRYAIERCFEVIGEALNRIRKIDPDTANRITGSSQIIGFRNILIHGYASVSDVRTWQTLTDDVPQLLREARELFFEGGGAPEDLD